MTILDQLIEAILAELAPEDDGEPDDPPRRCIACLWRGRTDGDECPGCGMRLAE